MRVAHLFSQQREDGGKINRQARRECASDARDDIIIFDSLGQGLGRLRSMHRGSDLVCKDLRKARLAAREIERCCGDRAAARLPTSLPR